MGLVQWLIVTAAVLMSFNSLLAVKLITRDCSSTFY